MPWIRFIWSAVRYIYFSARRIDPCLCSFEAMIVHSCFRFSNGSFLAGWPDLVADAFSPEPPRFRCQASTFPASCRLATASAGRRLSGLQARPNSPMHVPTHRPFPADPRLVQPPAMNPELFRQLQDVVAVPQPIDRHLPERLWISPYSPLCHSQLLSLQRVPIASVSF
jgi:hypothetical protein